MEIIPMENNLWGMFRVIRSDKPGENMADLQFVQRQNQKTRKHAN